MDDKPCKKHKGLYWLSVDEASEAVSKWPEWKKKYRIGPKKDTDGKYEVHE